MDPQFLADADFLGFWFLQQCSWSFHSSLIRYSVTRQLVPDVTRCHGLINL